MNEQRIEAARAGLKSWREAKGHNARDVDESNARDLITDLLHLIEDEAVKRAGPRQRAEGLVGFETAESNHRMAWGNYEGERGEGDDLEQDARELAEVKS